MQALNKVPHGGGCIDIVAICRDSIGWVSLSSRMHTRRVRQVLCSKLVLGHNKSCEEGEPRATLQV